MKKSVLMLVCFCVFCLASLSFLAGCDGSSISMTALPAPVLTEVVNDYVFWEEVPNASSYVLKVNSYQEDVGNNLKYSLVSILNGRVEPNVPTELHIYVKAKGNQIMYSDSEYSSELIYVYTASASVATANAAKLAVPTGLQMDETTLRWNAVPNANGYRIFIDGEDSSYTTAQTSFDFSAVFDSSRFFTAEIQSLSSDHSAFADSDKTVPTRFSFVKSEQKTQVGFSDLYKSNGLGRTIDLINADSYKPKSGAGYIFKEDALFSRTLLEEAIREQKATYEYGTSFESFYKKWQFDLGLKVSNNNLAIDGCFLPRTFDFNVELKGGYEQVRKEETKELYIKMHHNVVGKRVEVLGHASDYDYFASILSENFKNAARKVKDEKSAEEFISVWGTHVIMAAYYGAAFEATYYNISHDKYDEDNWYVDIEAAVKAHLFFSDLDIGLDFDLKRDTNSNTQNSLTKFEAYVVGGDGVALANDLAGFKDAYAAWASGLSDSNYTLIDFPENSLYCIWDFLDDSYAEEKAILNSYFRTHTQSQLNSIRSKISGLYNSDSTEYMDESHNVTYQASTKTMTVDLSTYQECGNLKDSTFSYNRFENGVLTITSIISGNEIENVVIKGSYGKKSREDGHIIKGAIKGFSAKFENWYDEINVSLEDISFLSDKEFALCFPAGSTVNLNVSGTCIIGSSVSGGGIIGALGGTVKSLCVHGSGDIEWSAGKGADATQLGASGAAGGVAISADHVRVDLSGSSSIVVRGGDGGHGKSGANGANGKNADKNDGGHGKNGSNGGNGGDGASAIIAKTLSVYPFLVAIAGNAGNGGDGGSGGDGGHWHNIISCGAGPGNGGKGGNGGSSGSISLPIQCLDEKVVGTVQEIYGCYGQSGAAGRGGAKGYHTGAYGHKCTGADGQRGDNGFGIKAKTTWNGHTYYLLLGSLDWTQAMETATAMGGYLATIQNEEENNTVKTMFVDFVSSVFLGGSDEEKEGDWKWLTSEKFSYKNWEAGEPNNCNSDEHFLQMCSTGYWNDVPKDYKLPGIVVEFN